MYLLALWVFQNKIIIFGLNGKYIAYKYSVQSKCDAQKEFIPAKEKSKMKTEKIVKVKKVKLHRFSGGQCESAYYAKSDSRKGYRWYVGYGSDLMPASRNDDITSYEYPQDDNGDDIVGNIVQMYRSGL